MGELMDDDVIPLVRKYALQNALEYDGKGQVGSTLGRLLSERQDLRPKAKDLMSLVCLLYTSPSPRDRTRSRMPSSA